MEAALEGLAGVEEVQVDLANDRFAVGYDPEQVTPQDMLRAIEELDFEPEIAGAGSTDRVKPTGPAPAPIAGALALAEREQKLLFLDFWAEWCAPCKVLEERTIADPRIQEFLSRHEFLRVDTDAHPEAARYFDAFGLPTIVVLSPAGEELYRRTGFIEADELASELAKLEARRQP